MNLITFLTLMLVGFACIVGNNLFLAAAFLAVGLILIIRGGDWFVDAAGWIAVRFGIPKFIVGATVVSVATTLPEIIVSTMAAFDASKAELAGDYALASDYIDTAAGNAIGSVTANLGLILGISLVFLPGAIKRRQFLPKALLMLGAAAVLCVFSSLLPLFTSLDHSVSLIPSILLALIFVLYIFDNLRTAKDATDECESVDKSAKTTVLNLGKFLFGTAGIVLGANLLIDNSKILATAAGIPAGIIAVTIIAVGTSLPELITTITAIRKKEASLSVGNIIGANTIDLALILPLCSVISGRALPVSTQTWVLDLPVCLLVGAVALLPAVFYKRFKRWQGFLLLASYAVYLTVLVLLFV